MSQEFNVANVAICILSKPLIIAKSIGLTHHCVVK